MAHDGEDAAFEKGSELVSDKVRQARPGLSLDACQENRELFLDHLTGNACRRCVSGRVDLVACPRAQPRQELQRSARRQKEIRTAARSHELVQPTELNWTAF